VEVQIRHADGRERAVVEAGLGAHVVALEGMAAAITREL